MSFKHQITSILIGLVTLALIGFGIYLFISALIDKLNSVNSDISKALIGASVAVIGAAITLVLGKLFEQRISIRQEIRSKKIPIYEEHMKVIFDFFFAAKKGGEAVAETQLTKAFLEFTEKLIIWGDSAVIKSWEEFRVHKWDADNPQTSIEAFVKFEKFIKTLRKDLGNDNSKLKDGDLLRLFITDYDTHFSTPNPISSLNKKSNSQK